MQKVLTCAQMRAADRYTIEERGIPSEELMRRAGLAVAEEVKKVAAGKKVLVVCGVGNNGGDGFVCAQNLYESGYKVAVYQVKGRLSEDCLREKSRYRGEYSAEICGEIIVDCLFGTGLSREVGGEYAAVTEKINNSVALVISVDIPSGLNGDNGKIMGIAVKADKTLTVQYLKTGLFLGDGKDCCGEIAVKDIGISANGGDYACIYDDNDIAGFFPVRKYNSHKGSYGTANIIAGSEKYPGAAALSAQGALKSGCGYVKLTTDEKVKYSLLPRFPQVIYNGEADLAADAVAIGMGCGRSAELYAKIKNILSEYCGSLIIDADGLNSIAEYGLDVLRKKRCKVLITPHVKEFSRLTGLKTEEILSDTVTCARDFAQKYGVCVLLKNSVSVICDGKRTALNIRGDSSLSKGGSGDILAGFIAGTVARGLSLFDGAVCSAYVLGCAAEISSENVTSYCATAQDVIKNLHFALKRLTGRKEVGKI